MNLKTFVSRGALLVLMSACSAYLSAELTLKSEDIEHGSFMSKKHEFSGFGCSGDNLSPHLSWESAPKGTKSFAITAYDLDAPTGSGWWHWQVINIPTSTQHLTTGISSNGESLSKKLVQIKNDYGVSAFGGACPPVGDKAHRYQFTVHALNVAKLDLPEGASSALVGYFINVHSLESASIEALYKRR